jgi:hypothetical protein
VIALDSRLRYQFVKNSILTKRCEENKRLRVKRNERRKNSVKLLK